MYTLQAVLKFIHKVSLVLEGRAKIAKNYESSDSENDIFITQNMFINESYKLDISDNDSFLFDAAQGLENIGNVTLENILKKRIIQTEPIHMIIQTTSRIYMTKKALCYRV